MAWRGTYMARIYRLYDAAVFPSLVKETNDYVIFLLLALASLLH